MPVRPEAVVIFVLASVGAGATRAAAQVGYPPSRSPYHDITEKQDFTVYGGYFKGNTGTAGVGPQSGALFGVRYALHVGGPAELVGRLARASSSRTVLDPNQPAATRDLGTTSQAIYLADVGITLNLTGQKSYRHFVPTAGFGLGIASGNRSPDASGYKFGSPFSINGSVGLRFVPGGNISVRAELTDYMFQLHYPNSFFVAPSGVTPILAANAGDNQWTHNLAVTFGVSYVFAR
jgi:hypothetical protein